MKNNLMQAKNGLWLVYLSFTPPLLLLLISQISPIYVERALLPSHAMFCIWLAWAFTKTKLPRPVQIFAFTMIFISALLGFYQHITYKGFPYGPFDRINESIQTRLLPGDTIIHSNKLSYLPSFYFDRKQDQSYIIDPPGSSTDTLSAATRNILRLTDKENIKSASADADRVWFVIYQKSIDELTSHGGKTHPQLEYLDQHFKLESIETWDDLKVYIYKK